jgi:hypothetical protein
MYYTFHDKSRPFMLIFYIEWKTTIFQGGFLSSFDVYSEDSLVIYRNFKETESEVAS